MGGKKFDRVFGEIMILLPEASKRLEEFEFFKPLEKKKTLHIACPYFCTVLELKCRIHGLTGIPQERMRLLFYGEVLQNDMVLPKDVFNKHVKEKHIVDDVFRCRCHDIEVEDHISDMTSGDSSSDEENEEDDDDDNDDEENKDKDNPENDEDTSAVAKRINKEGGVNVIDGTKGVNNEVEEDDEVDRLYKDRKAKIFDLQRDMELIQCGRYADVLAIQGYADEGAFANISDMVMQSFGLPRLARIRVLALADNIRRRLEIMHRDKTTLLVQVQANLMDQSATVTSKAINLNLNMNMNMNTATGEGMNLAEDGGASGETMFLRKKDVTDAWLNKLKGESRVIALEQERIQAIEAERLLKLHGRSPNTHPIELQMKINKIRRRCEKDDLGVSTSHKAVPVSWSWCCDKHSSDASALRESAVEARRRSNVADLHAFLMRSDCYRNGFLSREVLISAGRMQLKKCVLHMSDEELHALVTECAETREDQMSSQRWNAIEKGKGACHSNGGANLGLPVTKYSRLKFEKAMADAIAVRDRKRMIS
eukprot:gene10770-22495_t